MPVNDNVTQVTEETQAKAATTTQRTTQVTQEVQAQSASVSDDNVTQVTEEIQAQGAVETLNVTQVSEEVMAKAIDCGGPIPFEIQTPSQLLDEGQTAVIRRIFVDANLNGQTLTPIALTDNTETTLANITNSARATTEIAFQTYARQFSLRLTGMLTNRIEVFGVELDVATTGSEVTQ